jgi:phosphatidylglycerol lysyltransferase
LSPRDTMSLANNSIKNKDNRKQLADLVRSYLGPFIAFALFAAALWLIRHTLVELHFGEIREALHQLSLWAVGKAVLLTALNYLVLSGYDWTAVRYIGKSIPYSRVSLVSSMSFAFSNSLGLATITGGSVRFRFYSAWGLDGVDIARIIVFCAVTLWLGLSTVGGISLVVRPHPASSFGLLSSFAAPAAGIILLSLVAIYILSCFLRRRPYSFRNWRLSFPSGPLAIGQIAVSSIDWVLAASVLYVLLPGNGAVSYFHFLAVFLLAQTAGIVSQVPGGLGVVESIVAVFLSPVVPGHAVMASLVVYRLTYYLLPLLAASSALGVHEALDRRRQIARIASAAEKWATGIFPWFLAVAIFLAGVVLLISGATPAIDHRLAWLKPIVPLPVLEVSHFLSTLIGMALLLLSRAIQSRINAAYFLTVALLLGGIVFSLLKGFNYEESILLFVIIVLLFQARRYFYRKASLFADVFSFRWLVVIAAVLLGSVWLTFFSYRHVEYSGDALWSFTFHGDAPRSLRAMVGITTGLVVFGAARLLNRAKAEPTLPGDSDTERARSIVTQSRRTSAFLALLGDKRLLFSDDGEAFIMYGIEGRSCVALGDPVGPSEDSRELIWSFREMCDRHGGWPVFYEVGKDNLPVYLDVGLTPMKIGEEARVPLSGFALDGGDRKPLRQTVHRIDREQGIFDIVPVSDVPALLPELRMVSDMWLKTKHTREKGFSLGYFAEDYIRQFPIATVRIVGKVVAFANVLLGAEKEELSVDLMRYHPDSPSGVMEYLFTKLMLWGHDEGYRWFDLGIVPLAGLEDRSLAPLWNRLGARIYRHGEHFYNFQGLRRYKERFAPEWEPKYLVSVGGIHLPHILTNVATLISGGLKGVVAK